LKFGIAGRRSLGRRQNSWLKDLRRWLGCSSLDIFRGVVSRIWFDQLLKREGGKKKKKIESEDEDS
jgi:hypothetical protein